MDLLDQLADRRWLTTYSMEYADDAADDGLFGGSDFDADDAADDGLTPSPTVAPEFFDYLGVAATLRAGGQAHVG